MFRLRYNKINTQVIILIYSKLVAMLLPRLIVVATLILVVPTPYLYYAYATGSTNTTNGQFNPIQTGDLPVVNDPDLKVETVFEGLESPTAMAFLDANDILVLEKNKGTVQRIIDGNRQDEPVLDLDVAIRSERGLLGTAVATNSTNDKTFVLL
jgi:aldose sugar dehydrogenase